jgi:hypothetical protein
LDGFSDTTRNTVTLLLPKSTQQMLCPNLPRYVIQKITPIYMNTYSRLVKILCIKIVYPSELNLKYGPVSKTPGRWMQ